MDGPPDGPTPLTPHAPVNTPRFSLVVPAYNEEAYLPRLLDTVDRARTAYRGGSERVEVIVADNGSTDSTARVARERGCRAVHVAPRVIGCVRNGGARAARGDVLAFIDADSQLHPETFNEIDRMLADATVIGGTTGAEFERRSPGLACTYAALALFGVLFRGVRAFGHVAIDAGVVFCARADFEAIGGYRENHLWGEDVWLLLDLRRRGWRSGRRLAGGTRAPAVFSTRKFDRHGDWHYFTLPVRLGWEALRGRTGAARLYWYGAR